MSKQQQSISKSDEMAVNQGMPHKYKDVVKVMEIYPHMKYLEELSAGVRDIWKSTAFTDVDVVVDSKTFPCHRIVLAAMSHYFKTMFNSGFKESGQRQVTLKGIDAETFQQVLEYIYAGHEEVKDANVYQLLQASSMLQIRGLQAICDSYLQDHLSSSNCVGVWKHATGHGMKELARNSWKAIMKSFPDVVKGEEFLLLEKADLITIIEGKDLFTANEEFVCDAVLRWCKHDFKKRRNDLSELFQHLRFALMDLDYLCNVRDCNEIEDVKECRSIILKAIDEVNQGNILEKIPHSLYREEEVLCMVGTRSREPNPQKTEVQCFSIRHDQKFMFAPLPSEPGPCVAVCTLGQDIYLSGGYNQKELLLHFDSEKNQWNEYKDKIEGRWSHCMVAVDNCIYFVAGMSKTNDTLGSIEKFDPATKKCTHVGELVVPVSSMTAAVIGSRIYTFGGKKSDKTATDLIQYFDTSNGEREVVGNLPPDCAGVIGRAVQYEDRLFLVFRNGSVVEFSVDQAQPDVICSTDGFDHFGAVSLDGKILILGIRSGTFRSMVLDPNVGEIQEIPTKFKAPMCNFHCLKLVVSKKFLLQRQQS
ncbi:hypothetical protein FSP39_014903 [Pinctada imbricata]|uniref:BTB domain-containing protein n=1 Tax=Pinctada imbricata TaxID=66713 RepID=A0AA88XS37_PINIB|nr:hypothetical protein FSP39_014903 [Pinctada imbricata]